AQHQATTRINRRANLYRVRAILRLDKAHQLRAANEVGDGLPEITAAGQSDKRTARLVVPENAKLAVEHQDAVGHGRSGLAELPDHGRQPPLALVVTASKSVVVVEQLTPDAPRRGRIAAPAA